MLAFFKHKNSKVLSMLSMLVLGIGASSIFPPFNQALIGYICLFLFFTYVFNLNKIDKKAFFYCYLFGFSFFAVGFSWVCNALLVDEEEFRAYVPVVFIAMGLFFSLFISIPLFLVKFGKNIYAKGIIWCLGIVLFEWIRSFIFTGFPWNLFGSALSIDVRLIQGAGVVGCYGLSLMLLLFITGFSILFLGWVKKKNYKGGLYFIIIPLVFFSLFWFNKKDYVDGDLKVRLVQPAIPQMLKWNNDMLYQHFRSYIDLSKSKPLDGVDLVVWGETATPYPLDFDKRRLEEITEAIDKDGFLITGLIRFGLEQGEYVSYNSMFAIDGNGIIKDYYDKAHLVPFGEYMPFKEYLPDFMKPVADVVGNLKKGEKFKNIKVKGLPLMGGAICYESIFPKGVINPIDKPDILVVLANDGWYGMSAGPYQHLAATQMRAVEEGVTVIRSANTGISAVIRPNGDVIGAINLGEKGISDVLLPNVLSVNTIYGKYGNFVLLICMFVGLVLVIYLNKYTKEDK